MGFNQKINDSMNNMSRSVTTQMMKDAPPDLKYVYIGAIDEKTRPFCLEAASQGALTEEQILGLGGEFAESLVSGGGINCRHNWELASDDITGQFHRGGEAQKILDAKPIPVVKKKTIDDVNLYDGMPDKEFEPIWQEWRNRLDNGLEPLSREEAFHHWGSHKYVDIKNEFRAGKLESATAKYMDEVFKTVDGNHNKKSLYRGMTLYDDASVVGLDSEMFRPASPTIRKYKNLKKGDVVDIDIPESFSMDKDFTLSSYSDIYGNTIVNEAEDLRVLFKLDDVGKEGYNISRLSNHQSESEVLLRPKTKMTIKSTKLESAEKYGGSGGNILIIEATVK